MDDKQLTNGLRGLALAEPPLGFDPDEVATTAAKKIRTRRATIGAGLATLVVLGAAVTFLGPGESQAPSPVAVPSGPPPVNGLPPATDPQMLRNIEHLREVLPKLLPGATDITVPDLEPGQRPGMMTAVVEFHDDAGPASFNVTITSAKARSGMKSATDICDPDDPQRGPGGEPLRCEIIPQPGGGKVLLAESGHQGRNPDRVAAVTSFYAFGYRADGGYVGINNESYISQALAERYDFKDDEGFYRSIRPRFPLNEQQLMALVTDPAFALK